MGYNERLPFSKQALIKAQDRRVQIPQSRGLGKDHASGKDKMDEIVVLITSASKKEAEKIGTDLVEKHLAACANIIPSLTSIFSWEGKLCREEEVLLVVKSRKEIVERLIEAVKQHHSYSIPEIIALPIVAGSEDYLNWIRENTQPV